MKEATTPVVSGIVVLLAGLLAFVVVTGGGSDVTEPPTTGTPVVDVSLSDLDPAVERLLLSSGDAWVYRSDVEAGLPAELVRVLDAYQATLMIPAGEEP